MAKIILILVSWVLPLTLMAQSLSGTVTDKSTKESLISATVQLISSEGKSSYTSTDLNGFFQFKKLQPGTYTLQITYVGYKAYKEKLNLSTKQQRQVKIEMSEDARLLGEVSVQGRATRAEQKGDSLMYNAEAFQVMMGSSAEDLLAKMPGIVVEGGTIQAQGEQVQKVLVDGITDNETETSSFGKNNAYNVGADLMLRHRFLKEGRTLSLMLSGKMSNTDGDTYTDYLNTLYGLEISPATESYSQWKQTLNQQYSLRSNLNYTEKLTDNLQLQLGYKMSYTDSENDKKTYNHSAVTDLYDQLDESLSNEYQSGYLTQAGNVGLRYRAGKLSAMLGVDAQWANLKGDLVYPQPDELSHKYFSLLPSFTLRYSVDRNNSFQLRYRSKSSSPSVTNLQNVIDNSNPLFLSTGNPNLDQQVSHTANLRYLRTTKSGQTFIAMVGATIQQDYVADSTFVAREDIALSPTVTLNKGSQFTRPVNLDGYYSLQSMLTYGFPVDFIRSNINLSLSANYANVPTIFDGIESRTRELNLIPKIIIGSNISKNLDFTASYSAGINKMFSSLDNTAGSDYVTHTAAAKLGWTFFWGLTFRSTFNYIGYTGLDTGTEDYFLWNLSLGKKFLKNNAAEIKIEAFDVLKQNQAFTHRTGSNYYDYVSSNVLQPYAMISFVYTIR